MLGKGEKKGRRRGFVRVEQPVLRHGEEVVVGREGHRGELLPVLLEEAAHVLPDLSRARVLPSLCFGVTLQPPSAPPTFKRFPLQSTGGSLFLCE